MKNKRNLLTGVVLLFCITVFSQKRTTCENTSENRDLFSIDAVHKCPVEVNTSKKSLRTHIPREVRSIVDASQSKNREILRYNTTRQNKESQHKESVHFIDVKNMLKEVSTTYDDVE